MIRKDGQLNDLCKIYWKMTDEGKKKLILAGRELLNFQTLVREGKIIGRKKRHLSLIMKE